MKRIKLYEWLAGWLLTKAYKLHKARNTAWDWHECSHIYAGILAANTSHCPEECVLRSVIPPRFIDVDFIVAGKRFRARKG